MIDERFWQAVAIAVAANITAIFVMAVMWGS